MARRNIYIRAEDEDLFKQFEQVVGNFSDGVTKLVKKFLSENLAKRPGLQRIECLVTENGQPVRKSFWGRWLIPQRQPFVYRPEELHPGEARPPEYWAIAEGEAGGWLVLMAGTRAGVLDGSARWWLLKRGQDDVKSDELPQDVVARARHAAGFVEEEEIEL